MSTFLQREYWPTNDWLTCEPQAVGFQQAMFMRMQEHIQEQLPGWHSLLILASSSNLLLLPMIIFLLMHSICSNNQLYVIVRIAFMGSII